MSAPKDQPPRPPPATGPLRGDVQAQTGEGSTPGDEHRDAILDVPGPAGFLSASPGPRSPQFTLRAVLTGLVLGGVFSVCNVYVGLKTGATPNMSITAALLGFGFWGATRGLSGSRVPSWGLLENNISQTIGSSGALVASAGLAAPIPALAMLTGQTLRWPWLALWLLSVMLVGIAIAVPLRRRMIFVDKLPFPGGVATAEMLREIHAQGTGAMAKVAALASAAVAAGAVKLAQQFKLVASYALPFSIRGLSCETLSLTLDPAPLFAGIGGLIGFRTCCTLLIGAILAYGVISPPLIRGNYIRLSLVSESLTSVPVEVTLPSEITAGFRYNEARHTLEYSGIMTAAQRDEWLACSGDPAFRQAFQNLYHNSQTRYRDLNRWLLWPGMTLMVVASLVSLAVSWKSALAVLPWRRKAADQHPVARDPQDLPRAWFASGLAVAGLLSVVLQMALFGILWPVAVGAVLLTFALAMVAARVSGEAGIAPVGPLGKVTQLVFGVMTPHSPVPNLMAANVTGGAASQCADLLDDLKCGHMLGASPRWLTLAQVLGAVVGAMVGSAAYSWLVPNPSQMLASTEWPAPAAVVWKAVAEVFLVGFKALPPGTPTAMAIAALAGIVLPILERLAPRYLRPMVISPVSLGMAFVLPAGMTFSMFFGGLLALLLRRWFKNWAARFVVAICAGLIAGESLTGVGEAIWRLLVPH